MKALRLVSSVPQPLLVEEEMPRPQPQPGEVVVRVRAAAVTPTELLWYPTSHTRDGSDMSFPAKLRSAARVSGILPPARMSTE
jgi:NADPH:quinone reductase-like Zn-dependent oxidoreductase